MSSAWSVRRGGHRPRRRPAQRRAVDVDDDDLARADRRPGDRRARVHRASLHLVQPLGIGAVEDAPGQRHHEREGQSQQPRRAALEPAGERARPPVQDRRPEDVVEDLVARGAVPVRARQAPQEPRVPAAEALQHRPQPLRRDLRVGGEIVGRVGDLRPRGRDEEVQRLGGDLLLRRREPAHHAVDVGPHDLGGAAHPAQRVEAQGARPRPELPPPQRVHHELEVGRLDAPSAARGRAARAPPAVPRPCVASARRPGAISATTLSASPGSRATGASPAGSAALNCSTGRRIASRAASPERWSSRSRFPSRSPTRPL